MSTTSSLEGNYSPPSPLDLPYPYVTSSEHPDRLIRPLPKRRLRSRISSEVAESILSPQATTAPPNSKSDRNGSLSAGAVNTTPADQGADQPQDNVSYQFSGNQNAKGTEEVQGVEPRHPYWRQKNSSLGPLPSRNGVAGRGSDAARHIKPSFPASAVSSGDSVDGYDSFENTNNKKKRKVPTSGSLGNHHSSLSSDMAQMEISSARDVDVSPMDAEASIGQYYGSGRSIVSSPTGGSSVGGQSRGRMGRSGIRQYSGRSPLGPSSNGFNTGQPGRDAASSREHPSLETSKFAPLTSSQGQENAKGYDTPSSKGPNSVKTQFTFTCGSDSAKGMQWPGSESPSPSDGRDEPLAQRGGAQLPARGNRGIATQGTQTSPSRIEQVNQAQQPVSSPQAQQQPRKPRRSLAKQLAMAARERRLQQDYENYNNPPKEDKVWICQFCEYESIFGHPPEALIRQYEIKDRRERRRLAEKRRLLEKAKMKNKKGKKGNKNNKNNNGAQAQQHSMKERSDFHGQDANAGHGQINQDEEYLLDDYDDEPLVTPTMPSQPPSKIPQPINQSQSHRAATATGGVTAGGGPTSVGLR